MERYHKGQDWNTSTNNHNPEEHKHCTNFSDSFVVEHTKNNYFNYDIPQLHLGLSHHRYYLHLFVT